MIQKLLIANRGEIARRIIRTARAMGIETVALSTPEEHDAPWVLEANESFEFSDTELTQTYLNIEKILEVAKRMEVDAIHPGYGFLSENAEFAEKVENAGIKFVGPTPKSIYDMGNKLNASDYAEKAGVPVQKIFKGNKSNLLKLKSTLEYPVLIKAASGGGGKGMKKVYKPEDFEGALEQTSREAKSYFGNDQIYIERLITKARHIEVQVIGDGQGSVIHLGERDCSMQRRHQKVIEEAPASILTEEQRNEVTDYAINLAKAMQYRSAGTVEFLFDERGKFWFLEMNTRIQVEHPVTEMITGVDIVRMQLEIASGMPLSISQRDVQFRGHSIEARYYAEKPHNNFLPAAGPVYQLSFPKYEWLRIDSSIEIKGLASPNFDPMISKITVHAANRQEAIRRMEKVLNDTQLAGVETNQSFLKALIKSKEFESNEFHTSFIEEAFKTDEKIDNPEKYIAAFLSFIIEQKNVTERGVWATGYFRQIAPEWVILLNDQVYKTTWKKTLSGLEFTMNKMKYVVRDIGLNDRSLSLTLNDEKISISLFSYKNQVWIFDKSKTILTQRLLPKSGKKNQKVSKQQSALEAPMYGKVLTINAIAGTSIKAGDTLLVLEAMKMENHIQATGNAKVKNILVQEGQQVADGQLLMEFE